MDIQAKHIPADANGLRIAELDEMSYRCSLWSHRPLTDFWRVGRGYTKKLEEHGLFTMGDIARCSLGKPTDYLDGGTYKKDRLEISMPVSHPLRQRRILSSTIRLCDKLEIIDFFQTVP